MLKALEMQNALEDASTTTGGDKSKDGSPESPPGSSAPRSIQAHLLGVSWNSFTTVRKPDYSGWPLDTLVF